MPTCDASELLKANLIFLHELGECLKLEGNKIIYHYKRIEN